MRGLRLLKSLEGLRQKYQLLALLRNLLVFVREDGLGNL